MLIPLGFLAGSGGVEGDFELIETAIVSGTSTSTITFSGLASYASTYKHFQIRVVGRAGGLGFKLRLNGDTGSNYIGHQLFGSGSAVSSGLLTTDTSLSTAFTAASTSTANAFSAGVIDILDAYAAKNKTMRTFTGMTNNEYTFVALRSGLYLSTSSLTSITLLSESGNYVAGTRLSLYGIKG
jgi:hypothetical protein